MFMKYAELYNAGNRRNNYLHKNRGRETTFQYKIDEEDEKMYKNMFKAYTSVSVNEWLVSYLFTLTIYAVLLITLSVINIEMYTALWNIIPAHIKVIFLFSLFFFIHGFRARNIILNEIKAKYSPEIVHELIKKNMRIKKIVIGGGNLNYICVDM